VAAEAEEEWGGEKETEDRSGSGSRSRGNNTFPLLDLPPLGVDSWSNMSLRHAESRFQRSYHLTAMEVDEKVRGRKEVVRMPCLVM